MTFETLAEISSLTDKIVDHCEGQEGWRLNSIRKTAEEIHVLLDGVAEDMRLAKTPITEEWAATVRGDETLIFQDTVLDKWVLNCKGREGWVYAYVDTQGQVLGILNAVQPQKVGE